MSRIILLLLVPLLAASPLAGIHTEQVRKSPSLPPQASLMPVVDKETIIALPNSSTTSDDVRAYIDVLNSDNRIAGSLILEDNPGPEDARVVIRIEVERGDSELIVSAMQSSGLFAAVQYETLIPPTDYTNSPNDPGFTDQNSGKDAGYAFHDGRGGSNFNLVWELLNSAPNGPDSAPVAVIDSGFWLGHPDFVGTNVVAGWNTVSDNSDVSPCIASGGAEDSHGTRTAGIVAAEPNNGIATAGGTYDGKVIVYKVGIPTPDDDLRCLFQVSAVADAIYRAVNFDHVKVISLSGAYDPGFANVSLIQAAVQYALSQGVLTVAAAGNEGSRVSNVPAAYPETLGVMASDKYGQYAFFTNTASTNDIAAGGSEVAVLDMDGGWTTASGTSFATPLVASAASLLFRFHPDWTPQQVKETLINSARGDKKILDVAAALGVTRTETGTPCQTRSSLSVSPTVGAPSSPGTFFITTLDCSENPLRNFTQSDLAIFSTKGIQFGTFTNNQDGTYAIGFTFPSTSGVFTLSAAPADVSLSIPAAVDATALKDITMTWASVMGAPTVGQSVSANLDFVDPSNAVLNYQWIRDGVPISGATSASYTLASVDINHHVAVQITATKSGYNPRTITSGIITPGQPTLSISPTRITGSNLEVTGVAIVSGPDVKPNAAQPQLAYQWYRNGVAIPSADKYSYSIQPIDVDQYLSVEVTATADGYGAVSSESQAIRPRPGTVRIESINITGIPATGQQLRAAVGTVSPADSVRQYQWYRDGVAITGATNAAYVLTADDVAKEIMVSLTVDADGYFSRNETSAVVKGQLGTIIMPSLAITGVAITGQTVGVVVGTVSPGNVALQYQWFADGVPISGATGSSYLLTANEAGKQISVTLSASAPGYTPNSIAATPVTAGLGQAKVSVSMGSSGTVKPGSSVWAITATGSLSPSNASRSFAWFRDGVPIADATTSTYTIVGEDVGKSITVKITASAPGYVDGTSMSDAIVPVAGQALIGSAVIGGTAAVGETVNATVSGVSPASATLSYQWLRDGVAIDGATDSTFVLTSSDAGKSIRVRVWAQALGYNGDVRTSDAVVPAAPLPTMSVESFTVGGTVQVGNNIWVVITNPKIPLGASLSYQWLRDGVAIDGATASTYRVVAADAGKSVSVRLTASASGYQTLIVASNTVVPVAKEK